MVVSVVVGLRYMSISILSGRRISSRSRKLMLLLCSCDGVNCRLGCVLLVCWWIVWCIDHSLGVIVQAMVYAPHNPESNYDKTIIVPPLLHKDNSPLKQRTMHHTFLSY